MLVAGAFKAGVLHTPGDESLTDWLLVRDPPGGWTPASKSAGSGDLQVGLLMVVLQPRLEKAEPGGITMVTEERFYLSFSAENRSDVNKIDPPDQRALLARLKQQMEKQPATPLPELVPCMTVSDEFGNNYQFPGDYGRLMFSTWNFVGLRPKEVTFFTLQCERPVDKARYLYVDIPSPVAGGSEHFRFKVPIKPETVTYTPPNGTPQKLNVLYKRDDFQDWFMRRDRGQQ
jgi:hypothetical protein